MIIALALVAFFIATPLFVMRRWRLFFAIPASVLQLYLPGAGIGGFMPPLALLGGLALWPEFIRGIRILVKWPPTFILAIILLTYIVSLLWSVDIRMGMRAIIYLWIFLAIFAAVVLQLRRNERVVWNLLNITVLLAIMEAVLVIVFRISPDLEMVFLHSDLARLFINPNVLDVLFTSEKNNVLDSAKAGGFFTNGNVAGAYLWIMAVSAMLLGRRKNKPCMSFIAGFMIIAAYFTGSKTVMLLATLLSPIVLLMFFWNARFRKAWVTLGFLIICLTSTLGFLAVHVLDERTVVKEDGLLQRSDSALGVRKMIWEYGAQAFIQKPLLGQGFGGWQREYPKYAEMVGLNSDFPPHNTWIYLWSQGGGVAAALGIGYMLFVIGIGGRQILSFDASKSSVAVAMLSAFMWVFLHGMGTNFGLVGDVRMAPVLATLLALAYAISNKDVGKKLL